MTVQYFFADSGTSHYEAFLDYAEIVGYSDKERMDSLNRVLSEFRGTMIEVEGYRGSLGVIGMEFPTTEDLLFFKLKFN